MEMMGWPRRIYSNGLIGLVVALGPNLFGGLTAQAQVVQDSTLSTSVAEPTVNNFVITGGIQVGPNLFHSFSQFSVLTGGSASFNNLNTIQNIFARVTGGSASNIDGSIVANGTANLFLMNPAGLLFGPNAQLNIGGSFTATTANSIIFADGTTFSATAPTTSPLLTVSAPIGLQLGPNAGPIQIQGPPSPSVFARFQGIVAPPGQTLAFVGGQLDINSAAIVTSDGQMELWAVQNAQVGITTQPWQVISSPTTPTWGTITLRQASLVFDSGIDGGAINVRGRGLTVQDGSLIGVDTFGGQGKGITIQTTEFVNLLGVSDPAQGDLTGIRTAVFNAFGPGSTGKAGNITLETKSLQLSSAAWLASFTLSNNFQTGDVVVKADDIVIDGTNDRVDSLFPAIANLILDGRDNKAGNITIEANNISLINNGRISADLFVGSGRAGNISIRVRDTFRIQGANSLGSVSGVFSALQAGTLGQGGQISIQAGNLILAEGGTIAAGIGGAIGILSPGAQGTGGSITIQAREVQVSDPVIDTFTGFLSGITVAVGSGASGPGGSINLTTDNLRVFNGGQITSSSQGQGAAGNVNLVVNRMDVEGVSQNRINGQLLPSRIAASSTTAFAAGSVNLTADRLQVRNGAEITVSNSGTGDAGNLNISARNVFLDNGASLQASVNGGDQGNIQLQVGEILLLRRGSRIITNASGASTGGNITINAPFIVGVAGENSDITANAVRGRGGNIQITTRGIFGLKFRPQLTPESDITASSQFGLSGTVQINTLSLDPSTGLVELPVTPTDSSQQIAAGCANSQGSRFVATGRGGVPTNPTQGLVDDRPWGDTRDLSGYRDRASSQVGEPLAQTPTAPPIEANLWKYGADGSLELLATQPAGPNQALLSCAAIPVPIY